MRFDAEFVERFEQKFIPEPNSGCWLWTAGGDKHGYGRMRVGSLKDGTRTTAIAPRVSWMLYRGDPGKFNVCHACDNPPCVNPDHLFLGTQTDNMKDCSRKGRTSKGEKHSKIQRGHCRTGSDHHLYGKPGRLGSRNGQARLAEGDIPKIRSDSRGLVAIGADYGITISTVSSIKLRKSWKHVA